MLETAILSSSLDFTRGFERCCRDYDKLHIATAWCGNPNHGYGLPFTYLERYKGKITATIGTAFDQTHPDGIAFFMAQKANVRIFKDDGTLFHPKVYLFSSAGATALFIGSSNLTFSGFYRNTEINILIEGSQSRVDKHRLDELRRQLGLWHSEPLSFKPSDKWLSNYRKKFELNRKAQKKSPTRTPLKYEEQIPPASWLTSATWGTYYQKVLDGMKEHTRDKSEMLSFFKTVRGQVPIPWTTAYFDDLERRRIIGGYGPYGWFGHVGASGQFRHLLAQGTANQQNTIVDVINEISAINPPVDWDRLGRLLNRLVRIGPSMRVWSRLLCLIRPDLYCTVASFSVREQMSQVVEMPQSHFQSREGYVKLLRLIHSSPWFLSARPKDKDEAEIWQRRTAFLDTIFYE